MRADTAKHLLTIFVLALAGIIFMPIAAHAANTVTGAGGFTTIIDFFGLGGTGSCGAGGSGAFNTPCSDDPANGLFSAIACRVMKAFNAGVIPLYCNMIANPDYVQTVGAVSALYILIVGVSYIFGLIPMRLGPFMVKLLKLAIVFAIITNADLYFDLIYTPVLSLPQDIVKILLDSGVGGYASTGSQTFFQYVDRGIYQVFNEVLYPEVTDESGATYRKAELKVLLAGIALWQLGGDMVGGLFFAVIVGWMMAYISIMIRYLVAMLSLMFLLMLGPIFIPTILFDKTKYLVEDWIRMLISFIIQITMVVGFIVMTQSFFAEFYETVQEVMNGTVMKESTEKFTVPYGENAYNVENRTAYTPQAANDFMSSIFGGAAGGVAGTPAAEKLPQMTFKLIKMFIIVTLTFMFMQLIPQISVMLSGNSNFPRIFSGIDFEGMKHGRSERIGLASASNNGPKQSGEGVFNSIISGR